METRNFRSLLEGAWREDRVVCVGLDPDWDLIPESLKKTPRGKARKPDDVIVDFNRGIIDATSDVAGAYKPQMSYYEKFGVAGYDAVDITSLHIKNRAPRTAIIGDGKRGDIDRSNRGYIDSFFDNLQFDAITLHHYLGKQASRPFLECTDKGCIIMCRTSNQESGEFQDALIALREEGYKELIDGPARPDFEETDEFRNTCCETVAGNYYLIPTFKFVALRVAFHWNTDGNCLLVVGATYPEDAADVRTLVGDDMYLLVPGIGKQGGDLSAAVRACRNSRGEGFIVNSSSGIIHASSGNDFAECARRKAIELNCAINEIRKL